jgi:hypothetical protein
VPQTQPWPEARYWALAQLVENKFVMYGGFGANHVVSPELWCVGSPLVPLFRGLIVHVFRSRCWLRALTDTLQLSSPNLSLTVRVFDPVQQSWSVIAQTFVAVATSSSPLALTVATSSVTLPGQRKLVAVGGIVMGGNIALNYSLNAYVGEFLDATTWQWTAFEPGNPQATFDHTIFAQG